MNGARKPRVSLLCLAYCRIGLFSPFSFFFDSLVSGYLSFIFSPFFSSFTIRLELLLQGGWSGVRSVFGRLHYSIESIDELVGSIPVDIGTEFIFLSNYELHNN